MYSDEFTKEKMNINRKGMVLKMEIGKHFSITDPKGINTVIYQVNKTEREYLKEFPKYTVARLDYTAELRGETTRKTYYVDEPSPDRESISNSFIWSRKSSNKYGYIAWR